MTYSTTQETLVATFGLTIILAMEKLFLSAALVASLVSQVFSVSRFNDHSWKSVNCLKFDLVIEDSSNYTSDQILLQSGNIVEHVEYKGEKKPMQAEDEVEHCLGIKTFSEDSLAFDNYGISVSMLNVGSNENSDNFGMMGLIFNFQDNSNYDFAVLR